MPNVSQTTMTNPAEFTYDHTIELLLPHGIHI